MNKEMSRVISAVMNVSNIHVIHFEGAERVWVSDVSGSRGRSQQSVDVSVHCRVIE